MATCTLLNPTAVTRTGATDSWTGLGDGLPATSGPYIPGEKSWYVKFQIVPDVAAIFKPGTLQVSTQTTRTNITDGTTIIDDYVALGTSVGPTGANGAHLSDTYNASNNYGLSLGPFTLVNFNAGNVYLWLGYKAVPDSAINPNDFTIEIKPNDQIISNGGTTFARVDVFTVKVTYIGGGTPPLTVPLDLTGSAVSSGAGSGSCVFTGNVDNGLGGTNSNTISAGIHDVPAVSVTSDLTVMAGGSGSIYTYQVTMQSDGTVNNSNRHIRITHSLDAVIGAVVDSTLSLLSAMAQYSTRTNPDIIVPLGGGLAFGTFDRVPDKGVNPL